MSEATPRPRRPSPTLDALTRAATRTRLGARVEASPEGDARARVLVTKAAQAVWVSPSNVVADHVARHLVGAYQKAMHGHTPGEPPKLCAHDDVAELFAALRPLRASWRARALLDHSPETVASVETGLLVAELLATAKLTVADGRRDRVGAVVRGDEVHVALPVRGAAPVVRVVPRAGRLWTPEHEQTATGDRAR